MRVLPTPEGVLPPGSQLLASAPGAPGPAGPRSHLADGRCVTLLGAPVGWVVDAETAREPPSALARRHGRQDFWGRWTRAECAAKLTRTPIGLWLARHGLDTPDAGLFRLVSVDLVQDQLVVSLGRLRDSPDPCHPDELDPPGRAESRPAGYWPA